MYLENQQLLLKACMTLAIGLFLFGTIIIDSMINIGLYLILKVYIPFEEGSEQVRPLDLFLQPADILFECTLLVA